MTTAREALAGLIDEWLDDVAPLHLRRYIPVADAIIAKGWQSPAQVEAALAAQREGIAAVFEGEGPICPVHGIPDCSALLNGCSIPRYIRNTLALAATIARTYTQEVGE